MFSFTAKLDEILDMVVTWAALESMAAHIAASVASTSEIRALRGLLNVTASRHPVLVREYSDANIKFHQSVFDMSGSPLLNLLLMVCLLI